MKRAKALPSTWDELPPDLLGLMLQRLPSLADRVHLRAACRPWRAGAGALSHLLPPPLLWLVGGATLKVVASSSATGLALRDGSLVDLAGAAVRCAPILREGVDFGYLVVDNLAFLVHDDGGCSLIDPLTGSTLPLPKLAAAVCRALDESELYNQSYIRKTHVKAILSSPLDSSPNPLLAILIMEGNGIAVSACKQHDAITISMLPERPRGPNRTEVADIAFLHGKLYALNWCEGLHVVELDAGQLSKQKSSSGFRQCIADDPKPQQVYKFDDDPTYVYIVLRYLVDSNGRLLMVRRWMAVPRNALLGDHARPIRFEIFEADLATVPGRLTKVESLGGQALFFGSECSKSVLACQYAGGVREDCICYMHRTFDNPSTEFFSLCVDPLGDSGVYNMRSGEITQLLPEAVMTELLHKRQFLTWFFPVDA